MIVEFLYQGFCSTILTAKREYVYTRTLPLPSALTSSLSPIQLHLELLS